MKQIDILKALAIICVILLHSLPGNFLYPIFSQFHIWNAVPIFIILMSFTSYISFSNNATEGLSSFYTLSYFKKRFKRIMLPALPVFFITLAIGLILKKDMYLGIETLIGHMPLVGKGNYYITLVLEYIIISPLLYWCYKKFEYKAIISSFFINFIFEFICKYTSPNHYIYSSSIFRYLFLIFLGFYLFEVITTSKKLNKIIYVGCFISIIYLLACSNRNYEFSIFLNSWKSQLFISAFYPIVLIYLFFKIPLFNCDRLFIIGKASYHIFLTQMVFFCIDPIKRILQLLNTPNIVVLVLSLVLNTIICIFIGVQYYKLSNKFNSHKKRG